MRPKNKTKTLITLCALLFALPGCTTVPDGPAAATPAAVQTSTPAQTAVPMETPVPTPILTTPPDIAPTTPASTPGVTIGGTPAATPDDGRYTLTEGFYYVKLSDDVKQRITGMSYPEDDSDIEISYDDLRYVGVRYYDFEGDAHSGELIVNRRVAKEVLKIFYELYKAKYAFTSIRLVDDFGQPADDTLSMEANNTSAFCYRPVTGTAKLSRHSYGAAIDINPKLNPYIDRGRVAPENAAMYVDRSLGLPGMIDHDDLCYRLFKDHGWTWGGDWSGDKDYQHFSKDLGF